MKKRIRIPFSISWFLKWREEISSKNRNNNRRNKRITSNNKISSKNMMKRNTRIHNNTIKFTMENKPQKNLNTLRNLNLGMTVEIFNNHCYIYTTYSRPTLDKLKE
jgi:hypothetical protein